MILSSIPACAGIKKARDAAQRVVDKCSTLAVEGVSKVRQFTTLGPSGDDLTKLAAKGYLIVNGEEFKHDGSKAGTLRELSTKIGDSLELPSCPTTVCDDDSCSQCAQKDADIDFKFYKSLDKDGNPEGLLEGDDLKEWVKNKKEVIAVLDAEVQCVEVDDSDQLDHFYQD